MSKRGRPYERVVQVVAGAFDPDASITQGQWVIGPDGRRELDVRIEGMIGGRSIRGMIECKDFDPNRMGPVGIGHVDALDSKRRDLAMDFALMCSNAGFTTDAIRKARRVRIGLIGVMRKGDPRLRFAVVDEIYTRKIRIVSVRMHFQPIGSISLAGVASANVLYEGIPVESWVMRRIVGLLGSNPIVNGTFTATHAFRAPLTFTWQQETAEFAGLSFTIELSGGWYAHRTKIDASGAFYNWLRGRVLLVPGGGFVDIGPIDFAGGGELISRPPDRELIQELVTRGEIHLQFVLIDGIGTLDPSPDLDRHVLPEDLDYQLRDLPLVAQTSTALNR